MFKNSGEVLPRPFLRGTLLAVGVGIGALTVAACTDAPDVLPGRPATVLEHEYHPPYSTVVLVGKLPVTQYYPAQYHLEVMQCDRLADDTVDGNPDGCIVEHMSVDQETYEAYADGAQITFEEN